MSLCVLLLGMKPKVASLRVFSDVSSYSGVSYKYWRLSCKKHFGQFLFFAGWSSFLADWLVLTWKASLRNCFCWFVLRFREITYVKKLSFPRVSFRDLLLNKKQKKTFVLLNDEVTEAWLLLLVVRTNTSFLIHIITLFSYCSFISAGE